MNDKAYICKKCQHVQEYRDDKILIEIFCLGCKSYQLYDLIEDDTIEKGMVK